MTRRPPMQQTQSMVLLSLWSHECEITFYSAQPLEFKNTCIVLYFFFPWAQGRLSSYHNILVNQKIKSMMKGSQVVLGRLIEPNFDKLLKKSRDHNTIFCSWISNAIEHGCIISLDISTLWCLMEIGKNEACALEFTSTPIKACTKTPPHWR